MLAKLVLDRIEDAILVLDDRQNIILCNQALENMAGKSRHDLAFQPLSQVFPRFGLPRYQQILQDCLARGQVRFCSDMIHSAFVWPDDLAAERYRQNLQVKRLEQDGELYILLQITDITDHYQRIAHLKSLIKGLGSDYEQARDTGEKMREYAYSDALTGLHNRMFFMNQLRQEIRQAQKNQSVVAVLFLDLDGFKAVNDQFGHATGDLLLKQVAQRLRECVRSTDTVARFGGDEFAVILAHIAPEKKAQVRGIAEKICQTLQTPFILDSEPVCISASIGCSMFPVDADDPQSLVDMADRAMYRVKFGGKNNVALYES